MFSRLCRAPFASHERFFFQQSFSSSVDFVESISSSIRILVLSTLVLIVKFSLELLVKTSIGAFANHSIVDADAFLAV